MINYTFLKRPSPYHFKYANTNQICNFKDDIKIIAQSPCLLGHPVHHSSVKDILNNQGQFYSFIIDIEIN